MHIRSVTMGRPALASADSTGTLEKLDVLTYQLTTLSSMVDIATSVYGLIHDIGKDIASMIG